MFIELSAQVHHMVFFPLCTCDNIALIPTSDATTNNPWRNRGSTALAVHKECFSGLQKTPLLPGTLSPLLSLSLL